MKTKAMDEINKAIDEAMEISVAECKRALYMAIKEFEEDKRSNKEIVGFVKAYLLGKKEDEMLPGF